MKPPLDATHRPLAVGNKVMYCIDDIWSFGEVVEIKSRERYGRAYPIIKVQKCSINGYHGDLTVSSGVSYIQYPQKLIIVKDFLFLPQDLLGRLDEARGK